ncbi:hypothetical protein [Nocardia miyunensis]|uniref:hypothetical protein n=1 Tax=Nocardia miyunensis TaxID=282684 RepID=UPI000ABA8E84|nr:hypothetical protein [Nocardia miyunensis]
MSYTDRQLRNIVIFAVVALCLAVLVSGVAVVAVACMHHARHGASVSVPGVRAG